jgi:hypothetical protein
MLRFAKSRHVRCVAVLCRCRCMVYSVCLYVIPSKPFQIYR